MMEAVRLFALVLLAVRGTGGEATAGSGDYGSNQLQLPFLDLSADTGVCERFLPPFDDGHSRAVTIPGGFPFGNTTQHVAYVSTNGYISFRRAVTDFSRNHFNYTYILAPFWSDSDIYCSGEVVYTTYTRNEHRQGVNYPLDDVSSFLHESGEAASGFIATWMLVVQWNQVPPYSAGTNCDQSSEHNTFQGIAITNGNQSFAIFTYKCGSTVWTGAATIGYFAEEGSYEFHPLSESGNESAIACLNHPYSEWTTLVWQLSNYHSNTISDSQTVEGQCRAGCCHRATHQFCFVMHSTCACETSQQTECESLLEEQCSPEPYNHTFLDLNTTTEVMTNVLLDVISDPIDIEGGLPFGNIRATTAYVSVDGFISFDRPVGRNEPDMFPNGPVFVVAPYWTYTSIGEFGRISYEVHTAESSRDAILEEVNDLISMSRSTSFHGRWMLLVFWENVSPNMQVPNPLFSNRTNSFQAIVVTDGGNSYVVFVYHCCLMQWFGWRVAIGFNSDGFDLYENHPLSLLTDASAVACLNRPFSDWTNIIYRLDNNTETAETTATPTTTTGPGIITTVATSVAVGSAVLVAITVVVIACTYTYWKTHKKPRSKPCEGRSPLERRDSQAENPYTPMSSASAYVHWRQELAGFVVDPSEVELLECLGEGFFGKVYKGRFCHHSSESGSDTDCEVAVKTLKNASSQTDIDEFISESAIMANFDHSNVLKLLGVCFDAEDGLPLIILPFMANGDLRTYLTTKRQEDGAPYWEIPKELSLHILTRMSLDIATGMKYLAENKFVHRDLAARNCMVDHDLNVTVADFGLSRDVYIRDYYRLSHKAALPVKWMPPESLHDYVYNEKSDVWSFGVVCWEIFSLGRTPYPGLGNHEVPDYIAEGRKLKKPALCPEELYEIMLNCWDTSPKKRPTFTELCELFLAQVEKTEDNADARAKVPSPLPFQYKVPIRSQSTSAEQPSHTYKNVLPHYHELDGSDEEMFMSTPV